MSDQTATATLQFSIARSFAVAPHLLWGAWTNANLLSQWFHPAGVECPVSSIEIDARQGGRFHYTLVTPDGTRFPSHGEYLEFHPGEKLVFSWFEPGNPDAPPAIVIVMFSANPETGGTDFEFVLLGRPGMPGDQGFYDAWAQQFDHLQQLFS